MRRLVALFAFAALAAAQTPQNSATVWIGGAVSGASSLATVGAVPYVSAAGALSQDASNFFWDATNHRLGIGNAAPIAPLSVTGKITGPTFGGSFLNLTTGNGSTGNVELGANNDLYLTTATTGALTVKQTTSNVLIGGILTDGNYKLDVNNSGSSGTFRVKDQTPTTGATRILFDLGAADTSSTAIVTVNGVVKFGGSNSTGAGSALLGANSPAVTLTAPYTWIKVNTSDGSVAYIPAWK